MSETKETPKKKRPARKPLGERKGPLHYEVSEADKAEYQYRIVNDVGQRIAELQDRGYEIVDNTEVGDKVVDSARVRNRTEFAVGGGKTGRLMRIPKEWYDEDQAAKQKQIDELEATMRPENRNGQYGEIKVSRS